MSEAHSYCTDLSTVSLVKSYHIQWCLSTTKCLKDSVFGSYNLNKVWFYQHGEKINSICYFTLLHSL
jgi:hypothetical protein